MDDQEPRAGPTLGEAAAAVEDRARADRIERALLSQVLDEWPDGLPRPRDGGLSARTTVKTLDVFLTGSPLKAPHDRLRIASLRHSHLSPNPERVLEVLRWLARHPAAVADQAEDVAGRAYALAERSGMRLEHWRAATIEVQNMRGHVGVVARYRRIGETLERETTTVLLGGCLAGEKGWSRMRHDARAQPDREKASGRGIVVDEVTAWHLAGMTDAQRLALADLLAAHPQPEGVEALGAHAPTWNRSRLAARGIPLPRAIAGLRIVDGRVTGRLTVAPGMTWNDRRLTVTGAGLPSATMAALQGRPLASLVEHPSLPRDAVIVSAVERRRGARSPIVVAGVDAALIPFPRGMDEKWLATRRTR